MTDKELTEVMDRLQGAVAPWAELMLWLKECHAIAGGDEKTFITGTAFRLMISGGPFAKAGQK